MSESAFRVETTHRLAQWRIDALSSCTYRKSDPFRIGIWNWYLTVEKNKQLFVKLYPEASSVTREQPPIASFIIKLISSSSPNRRMLIHPGICDKQLKSNDDFVWAIDTLFTGRIIIDVEFLDLKIVPPSGGVPSSIWSGFDAEKQSLSSALSSLGRMLSEGIHADINIVTADDTTLGAHRAILAARSPVFHSMFAHDLREKSQSTVEISDMSSDACRAFLNVLYGTFRKDEFMAHRLALLRAADKYDIPELREACHESLLEDVGAENVLERLQAAHLYRLSRLKRSCMRYLVGFGKVYEIHDDFLGFVRGADRELLAEVFHEVLDGWKGF